MTPKELNYDIKKLAKSLTGYKGHDEAAFAQGPARKEFMRLYGADEKFEYMSKESVLILLRLNIRYQWLALHRFGAKFELPGERK